MGDLKSCLKEAKTAIKDRDYEAAIIHCKDALKIDRRCYQALAMFGRACLEQHRFIDSKKALLLATQIDPENPVAWQGLSSLHEKAESCFEKAEEIAVLNHMKEITKEEEKLDRIYRRLANVYQRHNCLLEAVNELELLTKVFSNESQIKGVYSLLIELLESRMNPSPEILFKLIETYEKVLNESEIGQNESNYQAYLRLLYRTKQFRPLLGGARAMAKIFPTAYPLEWIARAYVEFNNFSNSSENENEALISEENLEIYLDKLFILYNASPWGNLALGLIRLKEGNVEASKRHLKRGSELLETNLCAWMALLKAQTSSYDFSGTEITCTRMCLVLASTETPRLPKGFDDPDQLKQHLVNVRVDALFQLGRERHLREALNLLSSFDAMSLATRLSMIKAQVQLGLLEEAHKEIDVLRSEFGECGVVRKAVALIASSQKDFKAAKAIYEDILNEDATNSEALFELGRICFEEKDFKNALVYLLKAAKFEPEMSGAFLYIGHCYRLSENLEKARKCYEKALHLNPNNEDAGASLSDVYRITGRKEENLLLLMTVTRAGQSGWAWLRLGLHHMTLDNYDDAIRALQRALEIKPKDRVCFECLGDAYLARGSYDAALKVFTKATEYFPEESLYPRCRIAFINHMLGELLLSVSQYEKVLEGDLPTEVWIVSLVGLAQVLLARAKKYKQKQLLSNMKDDCLYALTCLTRAACEKANNISIWKMLGDACTMQALVPPSLSSFAVPARLLDSSVSHTAVTKEIDKKEMLLLGGRCYAVGLQVSPNNAALWHDLAANIFFQGYSTLKVVEEAKFSLQEMKEMGEHMDDVTERALTTIKKSLSLDPYSYNAWNTFGVIAFYKGNRSLAQHALIRSLELRPTVDAWTHLGAFYLTQDDVHLAHEAFSQAQALDPQFVTAWVGQAMVATAVGHYEAFDLYRHTTVLGFHPESCTGFASNVLGISCNNSDSTSVSQFMPNVADCLTFYCREKEKDALAHNMLGLSLEEMGLQNSASNAFHEAVLAAEQNQSLGADVVDGIRSNYSRALVRLNKIDEAIESYSKIKEPDFYSQCGLALCLLKATHFDDAYKKYTEACEWYAPDETQKAHVFVALAFLQYYFKNIEQVKSLLFQSSSVESLFALTALGLVEGDTALTAAALAELEPHSNETNHVHHITFLKAAQATTQSDFKEAKLILSRAIHRRPWKLQLWGFLSQHLLSMPVEGAVAVKRNSDGAFAAASAARALAQAARDKDTVFQDVVLRAMSRLKSLIAPPEVGKRKKKEAAQRKEVQLVREESKRLCMKEAQRAVLMCPGKPEAWAVLIAALDSQSQATALAQKWREKATTPQLKSWMESRSV